MKLLIFGDRRFNDYPLLKTIVDKFVFVQMGAIDSVISGKAKGADILGELWAKGQGLPVLGYPADWDTYGNAAGFIRNKEMAEVADVAIGFLAPESKGTPQMINLCKEKKIPLMVYKIDTGEIEVF
ncbi:MAG: DUF2493 domain-containing protein [Tenuifilaceae bacterium]|nr:DUF2493 domain-containing protein [Tenuifilaceae bacterium]